MKWVLIKDRLPDEGKQVIFDGDETGVTLASIKMNGKHPCLVGYESSGEEYYEDIAPYYRWLDEGEDELNEFLDWAYSGALETMQVIKPNDPKWRFDIGVFNTNEDLINHYKATK